MKKLYMLFYLMGSVPSIAQFCSPLNQNFGTNGLAVNYQLQLKNSEFDNQLHLEIGAGGKILQVGHAYSSSGDWIVMQRFLADGGRDLSFGDKGVVIYDSGSIYHVLNEVTYLTDGSFLLAGYLYNNAKASGWIARFLADGKEDYEFRSKASNNVLIKEEQTHLKAISQLPDGRILIAVNRYLSVFACGVTGFYPAVFLTCLHPDGTTDFSFGQDGVAEVKLASTINQNPLLSVLGNGKFLVASESGANCGCVTDAYYGTIFLSCDRQDLLVQRFGPDGKLDLSFGNQGKILDSASFGYLTAIKALPDEKILVLSGLGKLSLRRYLPDGSKDAGFAVNGFADLSQFENSFDQGSVELTGMVARDDGKIILVGSAFRSDQSSGPVFLQLEKEGRPDTGFFRSGWSEVLETNKRVNAQMYAAGMSNGQVVAAGRKEMENAPSELFVAAVSSSARNIYPEISPKGEVILCYNDSFLISTPTVGFYQWYKDDKALAGSTLSNINVKNFQGRFAVNVVNNDGCGLSQWVSVTTRPENFPGLIQWTGTELVANGGFVRYQWYLDNTPIPGATSVRYNPGTALGSYTFRAWDQYDCSVLSSAFALVITDVSDVTLGDAEIRFFPNPVRSTLIIQHRSNSLQRASIELYDQTGKKLLDKTLLSGRNAISMEAFKNGMYTLIFRSGNEHTSKKLIVLHD